MTRSSNGDGDGDGAYLVLIILISCVLGAIIGAISGGYNTKSNDSLLLGLLGGGIGGGVGGLIIGFFGSGLIITLWEWVFGPIWAWIGKRKGQKVAAPGYSLLILVAVPLGAVIGGRVAKEFIVGMFLGAGIGLFCAAWVAWSYDILWPKPISGRNNKVRLPLDSKDASDYCGPALGIRLLCLVIAHIPVLFIAYILYLSWDWTIGFYYGKIESLFGNSSPPPLTQTHHGWTTRNPSAPAAGLAIGVLAIGIMVLPVAIGCVCYYYYFSAVVLRILKHLGLSR